MGEAKAADAGPSRLQRTAGDRGGAAIALDRREGQQAGSNLRQSAAAADRAAVDLRQRIGEDHRGVVDDAAGQRTVIGDAVAKLELAGIDIRPAA